MRCNKSHSFLESYTRASSRRRQFLSPSQLRREEKNFLRWTAKITRQDRRPDPCKISNLLHRWWGNVIIIKLTSRLHHLKRKGGRRDFVFLWMKEPIRSLTKKKSRSDYFFFCRQKKNQKCVNLNFQVSTCSSILIHRLKSYRWEKNIFSWPLRSLPKQRRGGEDGRFTHLLFSFTCASFWYSFKEGGGMRRKKKVSGI